MLIKGGRNPEKVLIIDLTDKCVSVSEREYDFSSSVVQREAITAATDPWWYVLRNTLRD